MLRAPSSATAHCTPGEHARLRTIKPLAHLAGEQPGAGAMPRRSPASAAPEPATIDATWAVPDLIIIGIAREVAARSQAVDEIVLLPCRP
jgi:hypothetical protein